MDIRPPAEEITIGQMLRYMLAVLFVIVAYLYADTERFQQEQISAEIEAQRQAQIDTAKRADMQRLAERANRMMTPCCQASVVGTFEIRRQREYTPEGWRQVSD